MRRSNRPLLSEFSNQSRPTWRCTTLHQDTIRHSDLRIFPLLSHLGRRTCPERGWRAPSFPIREDTPPFVAGKDFDRDRLVSISTTGDIRRTKCAKAAHEHVRDAPVRAYDGWKMRGSRRGQAHVRRRTPALSASEWMRGRPSRRAEIGASPRTAKCDECTMGLAVAVIR